MTTEENVNCCQHCRFYTNDEIYFLIAGREGWGYCRKNPPSFNEEGFPPTRASWWCGYFDGTEEWHSIMSARYRQKQDALPKFNAEKFMKDRL